MQKAHYHKAHFGQSFIDLSAILWVRLSSCQMFFIFERDSSYPFDLDFLLLFISVHTVRNEYLVEHGHNCLLCCKIK